MAQGDVTILGPYGFSSTDMTAADTAITAARVSAADHWNPIVTANQWWMIHIEEA